MRYGLDDFGERCLARQKRIAFSTGDIGVGRIDGHRVLGGRRRNRRHTRLLRHGAAGRHAIRRHRIGR